MNKMIPISIPHLYKEDKKLAIEAIKKGYISQGENIKLFEKKMADYCGRKYSVSCSNGTTALYLAIKSLNLPKGSEVIIPSLTIISCLTAVLENGLKPVFCDSDLKTWNICFSSLRSKITDKTSAVMVVDMYGLMVDSHQMQNFTLEFPQIKIIEDASEAHGAKSNNKRAGSLGDVSTFSFYSNKIVATGEGGMILTDDEKTYEKLCALRNLNFVDRKKYIHSDTAFNFRLSNIHCSLGLGQIKNIKKTLKSRKRISERYRKNLQGNKNIQLPLDKNNVCWYFAVLVKEEKDLLIKKLIDNNVDYRHLFHPLHKQPFITEQESLPNCEFLYDKGLILPTYTKLKNKKIDFICDLINET